MTSVSALVPDALARLGVRRLVLSIHDASFPADPAEDTGRGTPYNAAGHDFLRFARRLGFDGVQMGPQGQTSLSNASPYDGALFSRDVMDVALRPLAEDAAWGGGLRREHVDDLVAGTPDSARRRSDHRHAFLARRIGVAAAFDGFRRNGSPERRAAFAGFRARHAHWLEPDALYEALTARHGHDDWCTWPEQGPSRFDRRLLDPRPGEEDACRARIGELRATHAEAIDLHAFGQFVLDVQHGELRRLTRELGLRLYGDLQVGVSHRDRWSRRALFLRDYVMGAPPSRTNPEGQPWGYPVLDPDLYFERGAPGPAQRFVAARLDKMLTEFDGVRLDHPHGLVYPWVYRADARDPMQAVRDGARLFASPDLPDHPALARFSIVGPEQIDRRVPRHADEWVATLTPAQVDRYGTLLEVVLAQARAHGRHESDVLCEVLSTWPNPLRAVMRRHGLGRFYVTQKADPANPQDVYRTANASPADWVMIGSHDTASLWELVGAWHGTARGTDWVRYLAQRLTPAGADASALATRFASSPGALAEAMLADLFVGPATHVSVFFADLLGLEERYNLPGSVGDHNWALRVPPDYADVHATRVRDGRALSPARSLALALRARGADPELAGRLETS